MEALNLTYSDWLVHQKNDNLLTEYNSVLNLRQFELTQATKPFKARGFKLKRCTRCLIEKHLCVCQNVHAVAQNHRFILVMYRGEAIKPSNTGRLIAEILPNTLAFPWSRTTVEKELLQALNDEDFKTYVVFPSRYAHDGQQLYTETELKEQIKVKGNSKMQFVILDGTWSEAKKMFRKSAYLKGFPLLSLEKEDAHQYQLREASRDEQLGTVSVALSILKTVDEQHAFNCLLNYADEFIQRYLSSKSRNPVNLATVKK